MSAYSTGWRATLDGVTLSGGSTEEDAYVAGCLKQPPDGVGVPALRTTDAIYPQRDGAEHFGDYYEPRMLTFLGTVGGDCGCNGPRADAAALMDAWKRRCDDVELVLWPDCDVQWGQNLLPNPEFDENTTGWDALEAALTWTDEEFHVAPAAARLETPFIPPSSNPQLYTNPAVPVTARGQKIKAAGYVRAADYGTAGGPILWRIRVQLADIGDGLIAEFTGEPTLPDIDTWTRVEVEFTAPSDPAIVKAFVIYEMTNGAGDPLSASAVYLWDTMSLLETEPIQPFGVIGRPRVAELTWRRGRKAIADATLRFDARDHRLYLLDADGTPGSGELCETETSIPAEPEFWTATVSGSLASVVDHHWPLDAPHLEFDPSNPPVGIAADIVGFDDGTTMTGSETPYFQAPSLSYRLGVSSLAAPTTVLGSDVYSGATNGMVGWWQEADANSHGLPAAVFATDSTHWIGQNPSTGAVSPHFRWGGSVIALDSDIADAMGFNGDGAPLAFIMVIWDATELNIYVRTQAANYVQTVTVSGMTSGTFPFITALAGRISNMVAGKNHYPDTDTGGTIANEIAAEGFAFPQSAVVIPEGGTECGPIRVSWDGVSTDHPPSLYTADGQLVGVQTGAAFTTDVINLDTSDGTANDGGIYDVSNFVFGDPFLEVSPGDTVYAFGGTGTADVTVCFRPSVISA